MPIGKLLADEEFEFGGDFAVEVVKALSPGLLADMAGSDGEGPGSV